MKQGLMIFTMMFMLVGCAEEKFNGNESASQLPGSDTPAPNVPNAPNLQSSGNCKTLMLVGRVTTQPSGVSPEILKAYDDILGRIDIYEAGGRYLTNLQANGYTVFSLRRDLVKTPEHASLLEKIYIHHLKRPPTTYEVAVHFNDLMIETTNMRAIEANLFSRCSRGE